MNPTTNITSQPEAAAVAQIVKDGMKPEVVEVSDGARKAHVLVTANGAEVSSIKELLDEYRAAPERVKGTAELTDLDSFIAHALRFSDADSALFAQRDSAHPKLLAVYDYHPIVESDGKAAAVARFAEHRAVYTFPVSDEWAAWAAMHGKEMRQAQFAEFLENRIADVRDPLSALEATKLAMERLLVTFASPSRLLDLARGLTVRVESVVANRQDLKSGESVLRFETTHQDERGAPLEVPGAFLVEIPVFRGGAAYQLAVRLRYRLRDGKVTWFYETFRMAESFDHAFHEACARATKETELPLFQGAPERP